MDYEQYEKACNRIRSENEELLAGFAQWLEKKGLTEKTIDKHIANINFYINEFLLYEELLTPEDGIYESGSFLGYWFIKKAMWANKSSIKSNAASLKKFYRFMLAHNSISKEAYTQLKEDIKEGMPEWLATLARYDDPTIEDPEDIWGF